MKRTLVVLTSCALAFGFAFMGVPGSDSSTAFAQKAPKTPKAAKAPKGAKAPKAAKAAKAPKDGSVCVGGFICAEPLSSVVVPLPANLGDFVLDMDAAEKLGKALFWDTQVGGDGKTACATCHQTAGEDGRFWNTVNPGRNGDFDLVELDAGGSPTGNFILEPGEQLRPGNFPFGGPFNAGGDVDEIVGSQGVVEKRFDSLMFGDPEDNCTDGPFADGVFHPFRQVTGRNTPNMIMAIFNRNNFWDGRADRDFLAELWGIPGEINPLPVVLAPASQASQEVGPPNNRVEMSCFGRTFFDLGKKMINNGLVPLGQQKVALDDGELGALSAFPGNGLTTTYKLMIRAAFRPELTSDTPVPGLGGVTQIEANFRFFWGVAVMKYGATLIPDQAPWDLAAAAGDPAGILSPSAILGFEVFEGIGRCEKCHRPPEFTTAAITNGGNFTEFDGFTNTGVRPIADDPGSATGKAQFKNPTLRGVEFTAPYFHNGGQLTLRQVVDFYDRGGDHPNVETNSAIRPLFLTEAEKVGLVDAMLALTDPRVPCKKGPFNTPSIVVPQNGGPDLVIAETGGMLPVAGVCSAPLITTFLGALPHAAVTP